MEIRVIGGRSKSLRKPHTGIWKRERLTYRQVVGPTLITATPVEEDGVWVVREVPEWIESVSERSSVRHRTVGDF